MTVEKAAGVDSDKKRKIDEKGDAGTRAEEFSDANETGDDTTLSPGTPAASMTGSGSGVSDSDSTNTALAGIMAMLKASKDQAGQTNYETKEWQLKMNETNFEMRKDLSTCTTNLTNLTGTVDSIAARVTALESGGGGTKGRSGGKGSNTSNHNIASPRAGVDPLSMEGGDAWANTRAAGLGFVPENASRPQHNADSEGGGAWGSYYGSNQNKWVSYSTLSAAAPSANPLARPLALRVGDRTTIIIGGFPSDTGRDEIESALRGIVGPKAEANGVTKIMAMGRYATCGRLEFSGNYAMWAFIKLNKRKKFPFGGKQDALWFSVEKTDYERLRSAKLTAILMRLVEFYMDKYGITKPEVKKIIDGDYTRGYVMFIRQEKRETGDDGVETIAVARFQQRIFDRIKGDKYFVADGAREIEEFKDFDWDEAVNNSNTMISKAEAYNNKEEESSGWS